MIRGEIMSTTEDYLDQLLKNASEKKETSDGELDFIEKDETMEARIEALLLENGYLYDKSEDVYIEDEGVFVIYYTI